MPTPDSRRLDELERRVDMLERKIISLDAAIGLLRWLGPIAVGFAAALIGHL